MAEKRLVFLVSPELGDGQHYSVVESGGDLLDVIKNWLDHVDMSAAPPVSILAITHFEVRTRLMTDDEINNLPDL